MKKFIGLTLMCMIFSLVVGLPQEVRAWTSLHLTVNSTGDEPDYAIDGLCETATGNGICTLRAALDEVNAAGGGPHVITIGSMTIAVGSSGWFLESLHVQPGVIVSIYGAGADETILDANHGLSILTIDSGAVVNLKNLTLANGRTPCCGGAIANAGYVFISNSTLRGNRSTALGEEGDPGVGGAIYNEPSGTVTLVNSSVIDNEARAMGGGINNQGNLIVLNSTFSFNRTVTSGGAIFNTGSLLVRNSTLSNNTPGFAGGGITNNGGSVAVYSSTIAENSAHLGAGINNFSGTVVLSNTIIANNHVTEGGNCDGQIVSYGFNLSNDYSCNLTSIGDRQGVDPKLGPLAHNGGLTMTHALLTTSRAVDAGFCVGPFDQRGYRRPVNIPFVRNVVNGCDIGAFEVQ